MLRFFCCLLGVFSLAACGEGLPAALRPTYPATKYFSGELLPPAQAIEADNQQKLARLLTPTLPKAAPNGMTLLLYAMMNRRRECMQVLLTHGIDPNQQMLLGQDREQAQAVGLAAGGEDLDMLRVLLDHGGNPNSQYQHTPALIQAAKADRFDQMRLLLDRGADINGQAPDGCTAAIVLADNAQFDQVAYLIKRGADIQKPDNYGATLAFSVQSRYVSPGMPAHQAQQQVKQLLTERGITFPVVHPGIAFQAKVRQENRQRRQWEAMPAGAQWLARINAATASTAPTAANEVLQLRQQAEPAFQTWRKTQPNWFATTNGGSFPLYNSPTDQDLLEVVEEPADSVIKNRGFKF